MSKGKVFASVDTGERRATGGLVVIALLLASGPAAAVPSPLPTQFAGEALTVAFAFAFPALLAGAYLALQRLHARLGGRTLLALGLTLAAIGSVAVVVDGKMTLLQRTIAALT